MSTVLFSGTLVKSETASNETRIHQSSKHQVEFGCFC